MARNLNDLEHIVAHLAAAPGALRQHRKVLEAARWRAPLYDTARSVRNFEVALRLMWDSEGRAACAVPGKNAGMKCCEIPQNAVRTFLHWDRNQIRLIQSDNQVHRLQRTQLPARAHGTWLCATPARAGARVCGGGVHGCRRGYTRCASRRGRSSEFKRGACAVAWGSCEGSGTARLARGRRRTASRIGRVALQQHLPAKLEARWRRGGCTWCACNVVVESLPSDWSLYKKVTCADRPRHVHQ